ncbi:hypothetical protein C8T65DRAFT_773272 [Cerioporus squamosus]|nr:hypothetical protein C8T65DRAFT_773272 [Cerioporus squamosus]
MTLRTPSPPANPTASIPNTPSKFKRSTEVFAGVDVTDEHLKECARLFSENYGVWALDVVRPLKPDHLQGGHVAMSVKRLRSQCLSDPNNTILVIARIQDEIVGHAFATKWQYGKDYVGWVTQLVVDVNQRKRYIATELLQTLKYHTWYEGVTMMGLVSSHPAACHALCKLNSLATKQVDLQFIATHAQGVLKSTTIEYLKTAELRGSLFQPSVTNGTVSSVYMQFFVDHAEPQEALNVYVEQNRWVLGALLDGHEFLLLLPVSPVSPTSRSSSVSI